MKSLLLAKPQGSAYITAGRKAQESVGHLVYILYVLHSVRDFSSPLISCKSYFHRCHFHFIIILLLCIYVVGLLHRSVN